MSTPLKIPRKGAVARLRDFYNNLRKQPLSREQRDELRDVFGKKERTSDDKKPKKIAKADNDLELP